MAVTYSTLFGKLGKLIAKSNSLESLMATTLPADLQAIVSQYGTAATTTGTAQEAIEGVHAAYRDIYESMRQARQRFGDFADTTILDHDTVVSQLTGVSTPTIDTVLRALIQDMIDNGQSVVKSTVSIGSVTSYSSNIGNGTILIDGTLDGTNPPLLGAMSHPRYNGVASELCPPSVTHYFECTNDSYADGTVEHSEIFRWSDGVQFSVFDLHSEGIGEGPSLVVAGDGGMVQNGDFEDFTDDVPDGWEVESGTAGEHVLQSTSVYYDGASALEIQGKGVTRVTMSYSFSQNLLTPRTRYLVTFRYRRGDTAATVGQVNVSFRGTGYTPSAGEEFELAATSLSTSWTLGYFYWNTPGNTPEDPAMVIDVSGPLTSGVKLYIDALTFTPVTYHGGVNAVIIPGTTPFVRGDRFYCTVTNSEGIIQKWSRRYWQIQWPSVASSTAAFAFLLPFSLFTAAGTATISDSLAS